MLRQQLQNIQHQSALHVLCKSQQQHPLPLPFPGIESSIREFKRQLQNDSGTSDEQDMGGGIYPGDTIALYGKSGTGKTYILSRILNDAIARQLDVVYIDLGHQYGSTEAAASATTAAADVAAMTAAAMMGSNNINPRQQHVHLFRPRTISDLLGLIHSLEKWFYDHHGGGNNRNVAWVMIDGEWHLGSGGDSSNHQQQQDLKQTLISKLKALQYHWPFALITTSQGKVNSLQQVTHEYRFECYKQDQAICMKLVPPSSSNHACPVDPLQNSLVTIID